MVVLEKVPVLFKISVGEIIEQCSSTITKNQDELRTKLPVGGSCSRIHIHPGGGKLFAHECYD
jgi:hypothetical protein